MGALNAPVGDGIRVHLALSCLGQACQAILPWRWETRRSKAHLCCNVVWYSGNTIHG